jgi:hypothetical protein
MKKRTDVSDHKAAVNDRGTVRSAFSENLKPIVLVGATATLGTVGFWLSPLRDIVGHLLWREKAAIFATTDSSRVLEGGTLRIQTAVIPQSQVPVDKGVLTFTADKRFLQHTGGQNAFPTPIIESPVVLPDGKGVELLALAPGVTDVEIQLQTKYGIYKTSVKIEIDAAVITGEATRANFTGSWILRIGSARGKMNIRQQGHTELAGDYFLDNGDKGVIDGSRDGISFEASFTRGNSVTRWMVERATIETTPGYLELKGSAYLQRAGTNGWTKEDPDRNFYATVALR